MDFQDFFPCYVNFKIIKVKYFKNFLPFPPHMNRLLIFSDKNIEELYQSYIKINSVKKSFLFSKITMPSALIYLLAMILEYFFSNFPEMRTLDWLLPRSAILICGIPLGHLFINCVKNSKKYSNSFDLVIVICMFLFNLGFSISANSSSECDGNKGYWQSFSGIYFTLIIFLVMKRWTYQAFYFGSHSVVAILFRTKSDYDKISTLKVAGFFVIIAFLTYFLEKYERENFLELYKLIEKDKMWKTLLDNLPEGVVIVDRNAEIKYKNKTIKENFIKISPKETQEKPTHQTSIGIEENSDVHFKFKRELSSWMRKMEVIQIKDIKEIGNLVNSDSDLEHLLKTNEPEKFNFKFDKNLLTQSSILHQLNSALQKDLISLKESLIFLMKDSIKKIK